MNWIALALVLALVPAFASPVSAFDVDLSWSSEVMGRALDPSARDFVSVRRSVSGSGIATFSSTPSHVVIDFATPGGPAHVELSRGVDFTLAENGRLPFDVPPIMGGTGVGVYPAGGGPFLASFAYQGTPEQPSSFVLRVMQPGSTAAPEFLFVGSGRTVSAAEPGMETLAAIALAAFAAVRVSRRARALLGPRSPAVQPR